MKVDNNTVELIADMEYIIGNQCYNPNSYNGWTGEEGCSFRYPVYTADRDKDTKEYIAEKFRGRARNLSIENVDTMKYKFGSNHLYIGEGLCGVLEYLENRYSIDFSEMEKNRKDKRSAS